MIHEDIHAAEELDRILTACLAGDAGPGARTVPAEHSALAEALVRLAMETTPSPIFASSLESTLLAQARATVHPPRHAVSRQRVLGWAALFLLVFLSLLAVPQVRASVLDVLRIGAVRIRLVEPTPSAPSPRATHTPARSSSTIDPTIAALRVPDAPLASVLELAGETTLESARQAVPFPIRLPTHPPELGAPDYVYLQELDGPVVVLVWMDSANPDQVRLSLHLLSSSSYAEKGQPQWIEETTVNDLPAIWSAGPYVLLYRSSVGPNIDLRRLVSGSVLLWYEAESGVTYRLESNLALDEARQIAESLR